MPQITNLFSLFLSLHAVEFIRGESINFFIFSLYKMINDEIQIKYGE